MRYLVLDSPATYERERERDQPIEAPISLGKPIGAVTICFQSIFLGCLEELTSLISLAGVAA